MTTILDLPKRDTVLKLLAETYALWAEEQRQLRKPYSILEDQTISAELAQKFTELMIAYDEWLG